MPRPRSATSETTPLLAEDSHSTTPQSQTHRCCCIGSCGCLAGIRWKDLILAFLGGASAPNGAEISARTYFNDVGYDFTMSIAAWFTATYINYSTSPTSSLKTQLKAGVKPKGVKPVILSASSGVAAISSGFLALATPYKLLNIVRQLMGYTALTTASIPVIVFGIFFLVCNTATSWNVGNFASASLVAKLPRIQHDLAKNPLRAFTAILCALFFNLCVSAPYSDGIADSVAGMASHHGSFMDRLQYLFLGKEKVKIDDKYLYTILYGCVFGFTGIANLISLTTFTFGPSYEFFFGLFTIYDTIKTTVEPITKSGPHIDSRTDFGPFWRHGITFIITSILTLSYGAAFGGFTYGTLESWNFAGHKTRAGISITATATTWGPLLYRAIYNLIYPRKEKRNPYYVMMQDYTSALTDLNNQNFNNEVMLSPDKVSTVIMKTKVVSENSDRELPLYRDRHYGYLLKIAEGPYAYNFDEDKPTQDDMIELISQVLSEQQLKNLYQGAKQSFPNAHTVTVERDWILHTKPDAEHPETKKFKFIASYTFGMGSTLQIQYLPESRPDSAALTMSDGGYNSLGSSPDRTTEQGTPGGGGAAAANGPFTIIDMKGVDPTSNA